MTRKSTIAVLAAVVALSTVACGSDAGGMSTGAGCEPASLSVEPAVAASGDSVTVTGRAMMDGCADSHGVDEDGNTVDLETQKPYEDVDIVFTVDGADPVTLATVDASDAGSFTVEVTVPDVDGGGTGLIEVKGTSARGAELTVAP